MEGAMTTKEKIEVIRAYDQGKPVEQRKIGSDAWYIQSSNRWDFDDYEYRVKPLPKTKFKAGDVVVLLSEEDEAFPELREITEVDDKKYIFDHILDRYHEHIDSCYVNVNRVLWYFAVTNRKEDTSYTHKLSTLAQMKKEFKGNSDIEYTPLYSLGFTLPKGFKK